MFIDGDRTATLSIAKGDGLEISSLYDKQLLKNIIDPAKGDQTSSARNIVSQLNRACEWLARQKSNKENGVILFYGNVLLDGELYKSNCYIPCWGENDAFVFSGYYKNYPLIKIFEQNTPPTCVAFDLKGWNGLNIRSDLLENDVWGQLCIREKTDEEIDVEIKEKSLDDQERNKIKGRCLVEYQLFWSLDKNSLPLKTIISLEKQEQNQDSLQEEKVQE